MPALMAFITGYSGGLSIQCRILRLGNLKENLFSCDYSFCGSPTGDVAHPLGDMSLVNTMSPLLLFISLYFFLYIFSCRRNLLLIFRLFPLIVALSIVVSTCLWKEENSKSSHILASPHQINCYLRPRLVHLNTLFPEWEENVFKVNIVQVYLYSLSKLQYS